MACDKSGSLVSHAETKKMKLLLLQDRFSWSEPMAYLWVAVSNPWNEIKLCYCFKHDKIQWK